MLVTSSAVQDAELGLEAQARLRRLRAACARPARGRCRSARFGRATDQALGALAHLGGGLVGEGDGGNAGSTPRSIRCAILCVITRVLPSPCRPAPGRGLQVLHGGISWARLRGADMGSVADKERMNAGGSQWGNDRWIMPAAALLDTILATIAARASCFPLPFPFRTGAGWIPRRKRGVLPQPAIPGSIFCAVFCAAVHAVPFGRSARRLAVARPVGGGGVPAVRPGAGGFAIGVTRNERIRWNDAPLARWWRRFPIHRFLAGVLAARRAAGMAQAAGPVIDDRGGTWS